jgi:hypothetical protein
MFQALKLVLCTYVFQKLEHLDVTSIAIHTIFGLPYVFISPHDTYMKRTQN